ncbi:transporter substrate-binding domain-containing protein [Defluviimonas sp. WL0002]|uniref:Transporter substrate-binding domain-containing protein n=1 Tax=Albidovulum marisflavi TaxID=2984159 RepID=A0ABT2ZHT8_9RHOB|nr:transporter substrate-binding domain-containing protein [Defluviimonas sp. WL0002]MCV2870603.1 transporter substrate-binding domain-containing protein [Defluviimonas sp. WL0002]
MEQRIQFFRVAAAGIAALLVGTSASAQEACTSYTVKAGDSLGTIAQSAYGTGEYQNIFNANRNVIGDDPANLVEGTVLNLPCEDGSIAGAASADAIIAEQTKIAASTPKSNAYEPPVKFLAGGNYAPFSDEGLSGGGFLVRLAETAMQRGGNTRGYQTAFVNDWGAHLETLLPTGAFDIGLGWFMPNCEKRDILSESMRYRCDQFDATLPVYEPVVGYYTMKDSPLAGATSFDAYKGKRICRMDGYFTFDLEEEGLTPPAIELMQPTLPSDCMEALVTGAVDVATMEIQSAADAIATLGISADVVENANLAKVVSMSFIAHKSNPFGKQYITMMNRGLSEMRNSGEWYAIISSTLKEHNDNLMKLAN